MKDKELKMSKRIKKIPPFFYSATNKKLFDFSKWWLNDEGKRCNPSSC